MNRIDREAGLPWVLWDFEGGPHRDAGATTWTILNDATENLAAVTTRRVKGTNALEFDKKDGTNFTVCGAYRTVDWNITENSAPYDHIAFYCYVSAITDVKYAFIRIGTSASHYNEYQISAHDLEAGTFALCHAPIHEPTSITGNGATLSNIDYLVVGVGFGVESDALANIAIDEICLLPSGPSASGHEVTSTHVDGTSFQDDTATPVISPDTDVGTTPVALAVPPGAKFLHIKGDARIRFGSNATLDGTDGDGYATLMAHEWSQAIPVLDEVAVYVRINAASGTCQVEHYWEKRTG
jgi:hypothetical protein